VRQPGDDVTVVVTAGGKVTVNGVLCAEVAVGIVDSRDTLAADLTLHRVADRILERLEDLDAVLADLKAKPSLDLAEGWLDGYRGVTRTIGDASVPGGVETRVPPKSGREYEAGYSVGRYVAAMALFLAGEKAGVET
jgi:hypothetical protein